MKKDTYKIQRNVKILIMVIVLLVCTLTVSIVAAKYITEKSSEGSVRASEFYFTSDFLDGKNHTLVPGSTSITFTLGNHGDDLRYSEVDINYTVTVTPEDSGAKVDVNGTGKNEGTLKKDEISDASVKISALQPGKKYIVTATGKGGYEKTLTTTIVVPDQTSKLYYHIDNSAGDYTLLTVWNEGDEAGTVNITYTGIPDNTNPNMTDWQSNGTDKETMEVQINPHESKTFRFFYGEKAVTIHNVTDKATDKDIEPKQPN